MGDEMSYLPVLNELPNPSRFAIKRVMRTRNKGGSVSANRIRRIKTPFFTSF
jgi:hypothetical protein